MPTVIDKYQLTLMDLLDAALCHPLSHCTQSWTLIRIEAWDTCVTAMN